MGSLSRTQLSDFTFTFHFHALEKEMATHSSVLTWRIPGTGEPGGLLSMRSHRVGHDWSDLAAAEYDYNKYLHRNKNNKNNFEDIIIALRTFDCTIIMDFTVSPYVCKCRHTDIHTKSDMHASLKMEYCVEIPLIWEVKRLPKIFILRPLTSLADGVG